MYKLSRNSKAKLCTCSQHIYEAVHYVLQFMDVGVAEGHRCKSTQNKLFDQHKSKVRWPKSKHNSIPAEAVDLVVHVPGFGYIDEKTDPDTYQQYYGYLAGILRVYCHEHGLFFRWGADWDGDVFFGDQDFDDLCHFEIYPLKSGKK